MNAARQALTNAVNRAIAAGSPVAVNVPVESRMNLGANQRESNPAVQDAYRAGLQQGISELVLTLELHGHLVVKA